MRPMSQTGDSLLPYMRCDEKPEPDEDLQNGVRCAAHVKVQLGMR